MTRLVARIHNPAGRELHCQPGCWCRRSVLGRAVRWYIPIRHFEVPDVWRVPETRDGRAAESGDAVPETFSLRAPVRRNLTSPTRPQADPGRPMSVLGSQPPQSGVDAIRAEHVAVAERVQREVDEMCFAAAEKRRAFVDEVIERLRRDLGQEGERPQLGHGVA